MIKQNTHQAAYFCLGGISQGTSVFATQLSQPVFNDNGANFADIGQGPPDRLSRIYSMHQPSNSFVKTHDYDAVT